MAPIDPHFPAKKTTTKKIPKPASMGGKADEDLLNSMLARALLRLFRIDMDPKIHRGGDRAPATSMDDQIGGSLEPTSKQVAVFM